MYTIAVKEIKFLGDALDNIRGFSSSVKQDIGYQLELVQHGAEPKDAKPMPSIGSG